MPKPYPEEFRQDVVRVARNRGPGVTVEQVATDFGVHPMTLWKWNAAAESFNSLIKVEYIHRRQFSTRTEARLKIATWITGFYNPRRRHSAAGGLPPEEFERIIAEARERHGQIDQTAQPKSLRNQGIDRPQPRLFRGGREWSAGRAPS